MPELPEVETIRRDLEKILLNKAIKNVDVRHTKTVRGEVDFFKQYFIGKFFVAIDRVGKLLIFHFSDSKNFLLVHLKMTGQLMSRFGNSVTKGGHSLGKIDVELPSKHTRVIINFADTTQLFFNDMRLFGFMEVVNLEKKELVVGKFGLRPFTTDFTLDKFVKIFVGRRVSLKSILLDQTKVAGIGNIYADEICFAAGIKPDRSAGKLSEEEIGSLFLHTTKILKKAVEERGTTFNNYVDGNGNKGNFVKFLQVYGRGGEPCTVCKSVLSKVRVAGRGTVYCVVCQK